MDWATQISTLQMKSDLETSIDLRQRLVKLAEKLKNSGLKVDEKIKLL